MSTACISPRRLPENHLSYLHWCNLIFYETFINNYCFVSIFDSPLSVQYIFCTNRHFTSQLPSSSKIIRKISVDRPGSLQNTFNSLACLPSRSMLVLFKWTPSRLLIYRVLEIKGCLDTYSVCIWFGVMIVHKTSASLPENCRILHGVLIVINCLLFNMRTAPSHSIHINPSAAQVFG